MTDHYETLGVPRDATPAEIKAAWRKLSSEHHPDREGGDAAKMAAVNRAFEVLGQPDKRKLYDETGNDGSTSQLEKAADDILRYFFGEAIDKQAEPVEYARRQLLAKDSELATFKAQAGIARKKLLALVGRTKTKRRTNLVEMVLAKKLADLDTNLAQMEAALMVQAKCREMLAEYVGDDIEARAKAERDAAMQQQNHAMQNAFGLGFQGYQFPAA